MNGWRNGALLAFGLAGFAGLCWWFGLDDLGAAARGLDPWPALAYAVLATIVLAGYSTRWFVVSQWLGSTVRWRDLVVCRLAGDAVGTLLPSPRMSGDPLRAFLVTRRGVPGPLAVAGVTADRIFETFGNILIAMIAVSVFSWTRSGPLLRGEIGSFFLVTALVLSSLVLPVVLLRKGHRPFSSILGDRLARRVALLGRMRRMFLETEDHLRVVVRRPVGFLLAGVLVSFAIEVAIVAELHCLLVAFGVRLDLGTLLMATILTGLSRVIPTPAGLGAAEGAQVALFALSANEPERGFLVALILRLHDTIWIALGLAALSFTRSRSTPKLRPETVSPR